MSIREFVPPILIRTVSSFFNGWSGNYGSWQEAMKHCTGYDSDLILKRVETALLKVKNGEAEYERDSVLFDEIQYAFPVLASLLWIYINSGNKLNLIDFGGSLGSTYYQNGKFLNDLQSVKWNIVEQEKFVNAGKKHFQDEKLFFF